MTMPGPRLPTAGEPLPTAGSGSPYPYRAAGPAPGPDEAARRGPVVVLTYAHAGGARLQALLADRLGFACTSGTGILPLCQQAAAAWRQAEDRPADAVLTPLAANSIRTLVTMMVTTIAARTGRRRWCEITTVQQQAAQTFLALYPQTRFICLHRACDGVIGAALAARPWGLSGPTFAPYTAAYPASTVAALAAYWVAHAGPLLAFEAAFPEACRRVCFEDLDADPSATTGALVEFLGHSGPLAAAAPAGRGGETMAAGIGDGAPLPVGQLPAHLRSQVDQLHARLGYPPLDYQSTSNAAGNG